ncbi:MAG: hypothetical protein LBJ92_02080 [Holosporales bacterium]|nr:hypothetical protein [Holosporales bacterium]
MQNRSVLEDLSTVSMPRKIDSEAFGKGSILNMLSSNLSLNIAEDILVLLLIRIQFYLRDVEF